MIHEAMKRLVYSRFTGEKPVSTTHMDPGLRRQSEKESSESF